MLSKEVFKGGMEHLTKVFIGWKCDISDPETMRTWYFHFQNMTDEGFRRMILQYVTEETAYPTVAGLLKNRPSTQAYQSEYTKEDYLYTLEKIRESKNPFIDGIEGDGDDNG